MAAIAPNTQDHSKRRVAYYYDESIGNYYYGAEHMMKPQRVRMTHSLLLNYGLYWQMDVYRPYPATFEEMTRFHSPRYINFIRTCNEYEPEKDDIKFYFTDDCPVFDGLYQFCQSSSGGSLAAAVKLNKQKADIAINWMGGLHHAKKQKASGFCYTNDIVLAILELLKYHTRVLYVDIDVHHGDGVEEAFYRTDRVMCVSFHSHGDGIFPGTGAMEDIGEDGGRLYSVNVPLRDGITDHSYQSVFQPIMTKVMEKFQPEVIVLQCGADSINGDKLGTFNLTFKGHGECVSFLRSYNVPMMMLGGGGYTPRNVARCWAYETALALDKEISNDLPNNDYYAIFRPDYQLHIEPSTAHNDNTREYLRRVVVTALQNLEEIDAAPSVQMQPIDDDSIHSFNDLSLLQDTANPDVRLHPSIMDSVTDDQGEFYDGETEGDDRRNEHNAKESDEREEELSVGDEEYEEEEEEGWSGFEDEEEGEEDRRVSDWPLREVDEEPIDSDDTRDANCVFRLEFDSDEDEEMTPGLIEVTPKSKKKEEQKGAEKRRASRLSAGPSMLIEPEEMTFRAPGEKKRITIMNISTGRKLIKMKCSDVTAYQFDPVYKFIGCGDTVNITVIRRCNTVREDRAVVMVVPCKLTDTGHRAVFDAVPDEQQEKHDVLLKALNPEGRGTAEDPVEID